MRWLVLLLFFLSGASGLVYEILWLRSMGLMIGNSVLAVTTVLAVFMGGLSLGSWLGGRWSDRLTRPLLSYGLLELVIGFYCLAFPLLQTACQPLAGAFYRSFQMQPGLLAFCQVCLGALLMLLPTALMGATYPVLMRQLVGREDELGQVTGRLYAVNTLGAVVGASSAGFLLLPQLGMQGTLYCAVCVNLAVGALACLQGRGLLVEPLAPRADGGGAPSPWVTRSVLGAFFLSGMVAMLHQVGWTRALSMSIGSTTYAFSAIVAAFILGLSLGGGVGSVVVGRIRQPAAGVALLLLLTGLSGLVTTWALGRYPLWIIEWVPIADVGHLEVLLIQIALLLAILLPPTFCSGMILPFVMAALSPDPQEMGRDVGKAYGINTLGTILGTILAGFILLPWLGIEVTSRGGALALAAVGSLLLLRWRVALAGGGLVVLALAALLVPRWDRDLVASGIYLYGPRYRKLAERRRTSIEEAIRGEGRSLFYRDGAVASVQVKQAHSGEVALMINGKTESSTRGDLRTQQLLIHLPMMFCREPQRVLVIGLGGGITLASTRCYSRIGALDCVEISPAVIEAAQGVFAPFNADALSPAKGFRMIQGDGRTHLALSGQQYDVISSEPSNPWIAGIANLFTREFFEIVKGHLAKGGVFGQWLHTYRMSQEDVRLIVRTFRRSFPHSYLFKTQLADNLNSGDYLLLGALQPLEVDLEAWEARYGASHPVRLDLAKAGFYQGVDLLDGFLLGPKGLAEFAGSGPLNTDDNALLEFSAPHSIYRSSVGAHLVSFTSRIEPASQLARSISPAEDASRRALFEAILTAQKNKLDSALASADRARKLSSRNMQALGLLSKIQRLLGERALAVGNLGDAIGHYIKARQVLAPWPKIQADDRVIIALQLGMIYRQLGDLARARQEFERAIALGPKNSLGHRELGLLMFKSGWVEQARQQLERAYQLGNREKIVLEMRAKLAGK